MLETASSVARLESRNTATVVDQRTTVGTHSSGSQNYYSVHDHDYLVLHHGCCFDCFDYIDHIGEIIYNVSVTVYTYL